MKGAQREASLPLGTSALSIQAFSPRGIWLQDLFANHACAKHLCVTLVLKACPRPRCPGKTDTHVTDVCISALIVPGESLQYQLVFSELSFCRGAHRCHVEYFLFISHLLLRITVNWFVFIRQAGSLR